MKNATDPALVFLLLSSGGLLGCAVQDSSGPSRNFELLGVEVGDSVETAEAILGREFHTQLVTQGFGLVADGEDEFFGRWTVQCNDLRVSRLHANPSRPFEEVRARLVSQWGEPDWKQDLGARITLGWGDVTCLEDPRGPDGQLDEDYLLLVPPLKYEGIGAVAAVLGEGVDSIITIEIQDGRTKGQDLIDASVQLEMGALRELIRSTEHSEVEFAVFSATHQGRVDVVSRLLEAGVHRKAVNAGIDALNVDPAAGGDAREELRGLLGRSR